MHLPILRRSVNLNLEKKNVHADSGKTLIKLLYVATLSHGVSIFLSPSMALAKHEAREMLKLDIPLAIFFSGMTAEEYASQMVLLRDYMSELSAVVISPEMVSKYQLCTQPLSVGTVLIILLLSLDQFLATPPRSLHSSGPLVPSYFEFPAKSTRRYPRVHYASL